MNLHSINWIKDLARKTIILYGWLKHYYLDLICHKSIQMSSIILPPASPGSLGDESLEIGLLTLIKSNVSDRVCILSPNVSDDWSHLGKELETPNINIHDQSVRNYFRLINYMSAYKNFYAIGADVLDGRHSFRWSKEIIRLANTACKIGLRSSIISFSFNKTPEKDIVNDLRLLDRKVRLSCRDPISQVRLIKHIVRKVELSADLAFLLPLKKNSELVKIANAWGQAQRANERIIIALNMNPQIFEVKDRDKKIGNLLISYKELIIKLSKTHHKISILFLPHDFRNFPNDLTLINNLMSILPDDIIINSFLPKNPFSAGEVRAIVGISDLILTARMHLAIHGLSQGVPVACVTYQDKFEGLMEHFKISGLTISSDDALDSNKLFNLVQEVFENKTLIRQRILEQLPKVIQLSKNNVLQKVERT